MKLKRLLPGLAAFAAIGLASTAAFASPAVFGPSSKSSQEYIKIASTKTYDTKAAVRLFSSAPHTVGAAIGNNTVLDKDFIVLGKTLGDAANAKTAAYDQAKINGVGTSARRLL